MRVLVPLDGSERSMRAMQKGVALLKDPQVTLLVIQNAGFEDAPEDMVEEFARNETDEIFPTRESCEVALATAQALLDVECECVTMEGKVHDLIIEQSANYDLLIMHALGREGWKEKLRLSGLEKVARHAECSVLLIQDD